MSMNPRETTDKIRSDYREYIASILSVKDKEITKLAHKSVKDTEFVKGPYLETTLPFVDGHSLEELADEGLVSKEFAVMGKSVHYSDWKLRIHQEQALRKIIEEKRNMVVSTGTGSGKTECYLYPIFNSLMREKENGTLDAGVRALLIFPMNALANDQQKKLRKLLKDYPDITFGRYTGETERKRSKETPEQAEKRLHEEYDLNHMNDTDEILKKSIPNELMSREMMAERPPHILLTNYAMLEYMLLRPDTAPFFDNASAKNWQFIVIDEAHTYKGANGTEIAFLLRRVKERIRHNMKKPFRCIATSATLGSEDAKAGLAAFAEKLFDEPFNETDVITTKRIRRDIPDDGRNFDKSDYVALKEQISDMTENEKGIILYNALSKDLRLFALYDALSTRPKKIEEVASVVFPDIPLEKEKEQALIDLIELAAAAKKSEFESALLPARYHLFVKSLEGMFVQYYPQKSVYLDRKEKIRQGKELYSVFEIANCQKCEQEYLIGKTIETTNGSYFVQTSSHDKPEYYFISDKEQVDLDLFDEDDAIEEIDKMSDLEKYHLCLCCGRITPFAEKHPVDCCDNNDSKKIVTVYHLKYSGKDSESNCCPCCGATKKGLIKRFLTANQPATFAVAKSLYDAIPPRPIKPVKQEIDIFDDDIFGDDLFEDDLFEDGKNANQSGTYDLNDESGRKLLIFSDNRQEAAFFAGFFEKKYCLIMWRKVILQCLKEAENNTLFVGDLIGRVMLAADKSGLYTFDHERKTDMTDDQKRELAAHYIMQEVISPDIQTGLEGLGYIQIEPEEQRLNPGRVVAGVSGTELWNLLRFMMDTLRQKGAITYPEYIRATDEFFAPRNHVGYFRGQGSKVERSGYTYGFIPQEKTLNKRLSLMLKLQNSSEMNAEEKDAKARAELQEVYQLLLKLILKNYLVETVDSSKGTVYCLNYAKWKFRYVNDGDKLYRCKKCGKIYSYSIKNLCPEMKCDGELEEIFASEIKNKPYYGNLFQDSKLIPMVSREHTAQLSARTAGEYQKDFEEGKINVLSCSTTFEMGVDVGELEATFQRNVPPQTSNYIQRAGRAGRRTSSAAFSVTFSRRNSHDMTFYHNPAQIIAGKIAEPVLEVDNEKIAERHLNSIVIAWFFKKYPAFFKENTKKIVSYDEDENMAIVLRQSLEEFPEELLASIHAALPDDICEKLDVDDWKFIEDIAGEEGSLTRAIVERSADIEGLKKFSAEVRSDEGDKKVKMLSRAIAAEKLISTLEDEPSINFLSSNGVLPKYGFPIDTVSLDIISGDSEETKKIELSRDLRMAISEFAPPAKIVANGKVWKSYAINTIPDKSWPAYIYHECPKCKKIYPPMGGMIDVTADLEEEGKRRCEHCGTMMNPRMFIVPVFGFSTQMGDKPSPVGETRPNTYYGTQTQFWGIENLTEKQKAATKEDTLIFNGKQVVINYSPGGKLFVLNQGSNGRGIRVCPSCGYAHDSATVVKTGKHNTKYKKTCGNRNLINVSLGHHFSTDIMSVKLPEHYINLSMPEGTQPKDQYISILYAILEGASTALDISREDISGCVTGNNTIILFDDTAGGSGFVKHIYNNFEKVLRAAMKKVSGTCGCTEETSCYGCLRNYSNQYYHDDISRGLAYRYIEWLLNGQMEEETAVQVKVIDSNEDVEETIGVRVSHYEPPASIGYDDTITALQNLYEEIDDQTVRETLKKLIDFARGKNFETPITEDYIQVEESIWPELIWGKSKVALFTPNQRNQYHKLKKYDWYCYILDENIDPERFFSHIKRGE